MQVFTSMCTYPHTSCLYKLVNMCVVYVSFDEPYSILASICCATVKVSGPFVETPRIFLCMLNINFAEILA